MADTKNFGLKGVGNDVQFGKSGSRIKLNSGVLEARNSSDAGFVVVRGADPSGLDDLVTKRYLETRASANITGQINGGSPPAVVSGAVYVCTTTGGAYTAKRIYYGENATWNEVIPVEGMTISVTDALAGGTITFSADHRYLWDADGSTWVDIGPATAFTETKVVKAVRATVNFDTASPINIGTALPVGATVTKIIVNVTAAVNDTGTVSFGIAGSVSELGTVSESSLTETGTYVIDCFKTYSSGEQIIATTTIGIGATVGAATVEMHYSLV